MAQKRKELHQPSRGHSNILVHAPVRRLQPALCEDPGIALLNCASVLQLLLITVEFAGVSLFSSFSSFSSASR